MDNPGESRGRVVRLAGHGREPLAFTLDGIAHGALSGDTVLTAVLAVAPALRGGDPREGNRAGFCLMGACQDCWMWQEQGPRLRACSTPIAAGMRLLTRPPGDWP
ncbi:(2Fe-2S)-binding protein [uncultured Alsobacter sp.]|uniref:(2Fe-2S)-binding protein n=1 Tax=uncultured Alsobacter sp. TaxID=1748258 RepID=UPI0025DAEDE8|nr:(2Fe-2S)-binding protein [uncultured Alsobacter sp.]